MARSRTSEARGRTIRLRIDTFFAKWCAFSGSRRCCIRSHSALGLHQKWGSRGRPIQSVQSSVQSFSSVQYKDSVLPPAGKLGEVIPTPGIQRSGLVGAGERSKARNPRSGGETDVLSTALHRPEHALSRPEAPFAPPWPARFHRITELN